MSDQWIGLNTGTPPDEAFGGTAGRGTPIVIDTLTDTPFYVKPGVGVTPLASGSGSELPIGSYYFSDNAVNPSVTLGYGTWSLIIQGYLNLT